MIINETQTSIQSINQLDRVMRKKTLILPIIAVVIFAWLAIVKFTNLFRLLQLAKLGFFNYPVLSNMFLAIFWTTFAICVFPIRNSSRKKQVELSFKNFLNYNGEMVGHFEFGEIQVRIADTSYNTNAQHFHEYSVFSEVAETQNFIFLFFNQTQVQVIDKNGLFLEGSKEELTALLQRKIPKYKKY